jgi:hypothetical protein
MKKYQEKKKPFQLTKRMFFLFSLFGPFYFQIS